MRTLALAIVLTAPAAADLGASASRSVAPPELEAGGSVRSRFESKNDLNFANGDQSYVLTQLRAHLKYAPERWFEALAEVQDARVFFEDPHAVPPVNRDATPNVYADQVDLHRAYLRLVGDVVGVKVGRQKLALGSERLVSSAEWLNTARVWDGATVRVGDEEARRLLLLGARAVPVDPGRTNGLEAVGSRYGDSQLYGAHYADRATLPGVALEAYWLLRVNADADDALDTVGARVETRVGRARFEGEAALQFGDFGGQQARGYMAHAGVDYAVPALAGSHVGAAYDLGSGDSDPNDDRHETFDNLFPLNHAYYGVMDLWALQNGHHVEATWAARPAPGVGVSAGWHGFWLHRAETDAWYNAGMRPMRLGRPGASAYVGQEVDVSASVRLWDERLALAAGYGHFFAGDFVAETGASQDADFAFVQLRGAMSGGVF